MKHNSTIITCHKGGHKGRPSNIGNNQHGAKANFNRALQFGNASANRTQGRFSTTNAGNGFSNGHSGIQGSLNSISNLLSNLNTSGGYYGGGNNQQLIGILGQVIKLISQLLGQLGNGGNGNGGGTSGGHNCGCGTGGYRRW